MLHNNIFCVPTRTQITTFGHKFRKTLSNIVNLTFNFISPRWRHKKYLKYLLNTFQPMQITYNSENLCGISLVKLKRRSKSFCYNFLRSELCPFLLTAQTKGYVLLVCDDNKQPSHISISCLWPRDAEHASMEFSRPISPALFLQPFGSSRTFCMNEMKNTLRSVSIFLLYSIILVIIISIFC